MKDKDFYSEPVRQAVPRIESLPSLATAANYNLADTFYDRLRQHIERIEAKLEEGQKLLVTFMNGGEIIKLVEIGYHNPHLFVLYGVDADGNECNLLAHMETVQLTVRVVVDDENTIYNPIGFLNQGPES